MLNKQRMKSVLSWIFVILWMLLIFNLSAEPGNQSNKLSTGVTEIVLKAVQAVAPGNDFNLETFNHIIRKCAHFSAYFVLSLLAMNAVRNGGRLKRKNVILAFVICVLYASSDEFHQIFIPGRGPMVTDVLIDSSGSAVGIGIYTCCIGCFSIFQKKRN